MYPIDLKFRPLDPAEPGFFPLLVSCNFQKVEVGMKQGRPKAEAAQARV